MGIDGFAGVTAIDVSAAGPTVSVTVTVSPDELALMSVVPSETAPATPAEVIGATATFDDAHDTAFVMSWVLPSV